MGVDCRVILPDRVRVRDVAEVIGILAGLNRSWDSTKSWIEVEGVKVETTSVPEMVSIILRGSLIDEQSDHSANFHFEGNPGRLLFPRSTAFWIAVSKGLIDFFGGELDYNDSDSIDIDYKVPAKPNIAPEKGKDWYDFQEALYNIKPLTIYDLIDANQYAAYKDSRYEKK